MEEEENYLVELTPEAEFYYFELLEYLYKSHSEESAEKKSDEILGMAMSLDKNPFRGSIEGKLTSFGKSYRHLVYHITKRNTLKIIYYIEETDHKVFITDFFGTSMDDNKMDKRL